MAGRFEYRVKDFDPVHIFECGQCFRWEKTDEDVFEGIAGARPARVTYLPSAENRYEGELIVDDCSNAPDRGFWYEYFDLGRDYGAIKRTLAEKDEVIARAIKSGEGIRILKQDRWEALISFIISQNNNIPRIKKNIRDLTELFGEPAGSIGGCEYHAFPEPEVLAALSPEDLAPVRLGYRARYLVETGRQIAENGTGYMDGHLTDLCGVGPKVANCVALFSMGRYDAFPVDTWVRQVMEREYGLTGKKAIESFAEETFGEFGGFAQQYLFYYIREQSACGQSHLVK
ncbi:MAG: DNA glycosylase [Anaerovoracaceae bacterium]|nr:DNA glycosylase [Anaerovoracaceae bacterium]